MSAYRLLGPFPQYFLADGSVNAGGYITFYETDLTTLQDTWSDVGLTTLNPNPLPLDASGAPINDVWGSAAYGAVLTDAAGANPRTLNNIQNGATGGLVIPSLVDGQYLTNNGSLLQWIALLLLPDITGESGKWLTTDGSVVNWAALPSNTTITPGTQSLVVGSVTLQWGSSSFPASGTNNTSESVSFPTAFSGNPYHVNVNPTGQSPTAIEGVLIANGINLTPSGFLAYADTNFTASGNSHTITNIVNFTWFAVGPT